MEYARQQREIKICREAALETLKCSPEQYPNILEEKFPHILEKILELWNTPDGEAYFNDLLRTDGISGGRMNRDGFPDKVWNEILRMKVLYGKPRPKPGK